MEHSLKITTCKPQILTDWIDCFIQFEGTGFFHTEIYAQSYAYILFNQNNCLNINFADKYLQTRKALIEPITVTPFTLETKLDDETVIFGAKVTTMFLYILTGIPLHLITGGIYKFDEIVKGNDIDDVINRIIAAKTISQKAEIIEKYFLKKIKMFQDKRRVDNYNTIKNLTDCLSNSYSIDQLIHKLNVSHKTLDRHFLKYTGVSPKKMLSLIRFTKTMEYAIKYKSFNLDTLWEFGYYDYSHFSKDFKKHYGKTFEEFRQRMNNDENLQVDTNKSNILLPEILIY